MRLSYLPEAATYLLLTTAAYAQRVVDELSFGQQEPISPNGRALPGWSMTSSNHNIQILSDRVILTPPVPGNARGAAWSDKPVNSETWTAEVQFRASGQDSGSGNLQFWFVKDKNQINVDSVYTAGQFDGLGLVVDQYGGRGGGIRGFLNDGTKNFRAQSSLEALAFGHCDYSYRNLGRPSKLTIKSGNGFSVRIDDRECFSSDKISLPSGYYFGLTAATGDQPDSFEVHKVIVSTGTSQAQDTVIKGPPAAQQQQQQQVPQLQKLDKFPGAPEAVPDKMAEEVKGQEEQFADLHNRIQGLTHQVHYLIGDFQQLVRTLDERHNQIIGELPTVPHDKIDNLGRRLETIERNIDQVKRDVEGKDYREHLDKLNQAIKNVQGGLTDSLPDTISQRKSTIPGVLYSRQLTSNRRSHICFRPTDGYVHIRCACDADNARWCLYCI